MKQYTTPEQTDKLRGLGFKKPKSIISAMAYMEDFVSEPCLDCETAYSIGELIEILPEAICESKDDSYHYFLSIGTNSLTWKVFYESEDEVALCSTFGVELIDALYAMILQLKKEGVI